jgi:hypothetical protein
MVKGGRRSARRSRRRGVMSLQYYGGGRKMHARSTKRSRGGQSGIMGLGDFERGGRQTANVKWIPMNAVGGRRSVRRRRGARRSRRGGQDLMRDQKGGMIDGGLVVRDTYAKGMEGVRGEVTAFGGEARAMGGEAEVINVPVKAEGGRSRGRRGGAQYPFDEIKGRGEEGV